MGDRNRTASYPCRYHDTDSPIDSRVLYRRHDYYGYHDSHFCPADQISGSQSSLVCSSVFGEHVNGTDHTAYGDNFLFSEESF